MNVGPVREPPGSDPQTPESKTQAVPPRAQTADLDRSSSRQAPAQKAAAPVPEFPQDEVRVQWDTPLADYIMVYQFLDQQSGSLILQMPDAQILSLVHQIRETLQRAQEQAGEAATSVEPAKGE